MDIRYLENQQLDKARWDQAVAQSPTGLPYAYSWYLDTLIDHQWAGLVTGDYEYVMPLPWNAKLFGVPQLFQPSYCQQLGVLGPKVDGSILEAFLKAIPNRFRYVLIAVHDYQASYQNWQIEGVLRAKNNLILPLNAAYSDLSSHFSKSLRKRLRRASNQLTLESVGDIAQLIEFYQTQLGHKVMVSAKVYTRLDRLFSELLDRQMAEMYVVKDASGNICCRALFVVTKGRIINLFGASDENGKALFAMHFLLAKVIEKYAEQAMVFDFEGSEILGIAAFFQSFGAQSMPFLEYKRDQLPIWLSRIRERRF
jgi:hypothetical protein